MNTTIYLIPKDATLMNTPQYVHEPPSDHDYQMVINMARQIFIINRPDKQMSKVKKLALIGLENDINQQILAIQIVVDDINLNAETIKEIIDQSNNTVFTIQINNEDLSIVNYVYKNKKLIKQTDVSKIKTKLDNQNVNNNEKIDWDQELINLMDENK